jgi:hypothetical protein
MNRPPIFGAVGQTSLETIAFSARCELEQRYPVLRIIISNCPSSHHHIIMMSARSSNIVMEVGEGIAPDHSEPTNYFLIVSSVVYLVLSRNS